MTVTEIKQAILNLPKDDFADVAEWLYELCECDWEKWDRQLEADVASGRLDFLAAEALEARRNGTLTDL